MMFKKISQNFAKSPLKFCLSSQILGHRLLHVCHPPNNVHVGMNIYAIKFSRRAIVSFWQNGSAQVLADS